MDKLKPILEQKFWIILGTGLILTVVGWWMATDSLAKTIEERKTAIKTAEDGIPSGELPNDSWSTQLAEINTKQEAMVATVRRQLWEQQKATMTWPENVQEFAAELPYRGDFNLVARNLYRSSYMFAVEQFWRLVRPIDLDGTGIVAFPMDKMPIKKSILGDLAPSSKVIWDAQEDLWLTAPILLAIRDVNGGAEGSRLDASVHIIEKFELLGGERTTGQSSSGSAAGDGADTGMMMGAMMGGGGASRGGDGRAQSADFGPDEEFGTTGRENASGGVSMSMAAMGMDGGDTGGGQAPAEVRRYVDDDESAPYKTRAFYLSVVMDHRRVPHLLAELTAGGNSPWPIEIVRVQMARVNPDDAEGRSLGGNPLAGIGPRPSMAIAADDGALDGAFDPAYAPPGVGTGASAANAQLSLEAALQDPFISRVAIAGLIYMYRPVDAPPPAEPTPETSDVPVAEMPAEEALPGDVSTPAANTEALPVDPAATPATPTTPVPESADPSATQPSATPEPAPAAAPPATPDPAAATPAPSP